MKTLALFLLAATLTIGCTSSKVVNSSKGFKRTAYIVDDSTVVIVSRTTLSMAEYERILAATEKRRSNQD